MSNTSKVLFVVGLLFAGLAAAPTHAQRCPSLSIGECRKTAAEGGDLLHEPNANGQLIWTTKCGPNTFRAPADKVCREISQCQAAGGFGKFLSAVTGQCESKHFRGYFGLDGLTFGILDWTEDNLPMLLHAYQQRSAASFTATLGALALPIKDGCLDPKWACDNNKKGVLMCDATFRAAFEKALGTAEFQQAQAIEALAAYETRLKRFESLGLASEYGNVAMAVVANNLRGGEDCRPATWKATCAGQPDEKRLVDCMLDQYVAHECRGSRRASESRRDEIKRVFASATEAGIVHPAADAVIGCSANWGQN
jgi:hypothetical protein